MSPFQVCITEFAKPGTRALVAEGSPMTRARPLCQVAEAAERLIGLGQVATVSLSMLLAACEQGADPEALSLREQQRRTAMIAPDRVGDLVDSPEDANSYAAAIGLGVDWVLYCEHRERRSSQEHSEDRGLMLTGQILCLAEVKNQLLDAERTGARPAPAR